MPLSPLPSIAPGWFAGSTQSPTRIKDSPPSLVEGTRWLDVSTVPPAMYMAKGGKWVLLATFEGSIQWRIATRVSRT